MAQIDRCVHAERNISMLMERILSRENLLRALKRVERNKGSHGIDEMSVKDLRRHL
jgi:RNA-directed DNA polymerase